MCQALLSIRGKTLITTHSLADVDAVASAVVLGEMLANRVKTDVRLVDQASAGAKRVLSSLGLHAPVIEDLDYSNVILVDLTSPELLVNWRKGIEEFKGTKIIIDHHYHVRPLKAQVTYVNRNKPSCCEVIYQIMRLLGVKPNRQQAKLLLAGIVADTANFKSATPFTFEAVGVLLKHAGEDFSSVQELVEGKRVLSERIATLKAASRAKVTRIGEFLVGTTEVNAFELQCAVSLVQAGCDVAFAANSFEGRISGAKHEALKGVHIGKIMGAAGRVLRGSGGGHENVGGAKGSPEKTITALEKCVVEAQKQLSKLVKPPSTAKPKQVI